MMKLAYLHRFDVQQRLKFLLKFGSLKHLKNDYVTLHKDRVEEMVDRFYKGRLSGRWILRCPLGGWLIVIISSSQSIGIRFSQKVDKSDV